jgi:hypothetical protein
MYEAYSDYESMMNLAEEIVTRCAMSIHGRLHVDYQVSHTDLLVGSHHISIIYVLFFCMNFYFKYIYSKLIMFSISMFIFICITYTTILVLSFSRRTKSEHLTVVFN